MAEEGVVEIRTPSTKRRVVIIDGQKLEMLNHDELGLPAGVRLREVLAGFRDRAKMTEESALALAKALARAVRDVLPGLPKAIDDKLSDDNRIDICLAFFKATETPAPAMAESLPVPS